MGKESGLTGTFGDGERVLRSAWQRRRFDVLAGLALCGMGIVLFSSHISGRGTFLGDSDRLNTFLNVRKFEVESLQKLGRVPAWNELMFMGFGTFGFPVMLVGSDPLAYLEALFPLGDLFRIAGYASFALVVLAGWTAYLFIKETCGEAFSAFVGAALYAFSTFSILRIAQVDSAFALLIVIPLVLLILRRLTAANSAQCFLGLTLLLAWLFSCSFLQEVAYAMLLFVAYALYRGLWRRSWRPPVVFGASVGVAVLIAIPRLFTVFEEIGLVDRGRVPWAPNRREILRLFDDGIFGRFHQEARAFGTGINLHEGLLLYTSTFAAIFLLVGLVRFRGGWLRLFRFRDEDLSFHAWSVVAVLGAILTRPGQYLLDLLFLKMAFLHARISIAALLPTCTLVAVLVHDVRGTSEDRVPRGKHIWLFSLAAVGALGLAWSINGLAEGTLTARLGLTQGIDIGDRMFVLPKELTRVALATLTFFGLRTAIMACRKQVRTRAVLGYCLGLVTVFHGFGYAWFKINGDYTWSYPIPFKDNNFFNVKPGQLYLPGRETLLAFHERLEVGQFRSVVICDPRVYAVFCAPHLSQFWRIRLVDGYVPGVPVRLASLPWPKEVRTLRAISFPSLRVLPWPLLSLLNVKYALTANEAFYYNRAADGVSGRVEARPQDVEIRINPFPVAPRQFFVESVQPAVSVRDAVARLTAALLPGDVPGDVTTVSVVEGVSGPARFSTQGDIRVRYQADEIDVHLDPMDQPRFLVLNELYHPRWMAFAGKIELKIFPTNVVMRGLVVPPGITHIRLQFVPFLFTPTALLLLGGGCGLVGVGCWAFRRVDTAWGSLPNPPGRSGCGTRRSFG